MSEINQRKSVAKKPRGSAKTSCRICHGEHESKQCAKLTPAHCRFCFVKGHGLDLCPQITCKHCKQKGHSEAACARNRCDKCGGYGHKNSECNRLAPTAIKKKHKAIIQQSLDDMRAMQQAEEDEEIQRLGESLAVNQMLEEKEIPASSEAVDAMFEDAKAASRETIAELKQTTDEEKLMALMSSDLPPAIVMELAEIPLYNPNWDGKEAPIRERFLPAVPEELSAFKAYVMLHFYVQGYSPQSLRSALAKTHLWLTRQGKSDRDLDPALIETATQIVWACFKSRQQVGTLWDRIKLFVYDWWVDFCERPSTWFAASLVLGAIGAGLTWKVGSLHSALIMMGVTAVSWFVQWLIRKYQARTHTIVEEDCKTLEDYCTGTDHIESAISHQAKVTVQPGNKCDPVQFQVGFTIAPGAIWIPRLCWHNELNALQYRQLLPPLGDHHERSLKWRRGCTALKEMLPPVIVPPQALNNDAMEVFLQKYPAGRRAQIRQAYQNIEGTLVLRECTTKAFVKREWLVGKRVEKRNPRLISGKTDEYLAETGPEYYFWMKSMCATYWPDVATSVAGQFIYTGGMTGDQVGAIFTHFVMDRGWEVIEGDYSRYDGHNEAEALEAQLGYYANVMTDTTINALSRQLKTTGKTSCGHKFSCVGKVASGVINTSFGNTLMGFQIVASYADEHKITDFAVMQLGDDNVIYVKSVEEWDLNRFTGHCYSMGHKLEAVWRKDPDFAEYCSQRFWNVGDRYVLGPKPARVLAKTFVCHDVSLNADDMQGYCQQIAVGFQHYTWVPLLGPVVQNLAGSGARVTKKVRAIINREKQAQFHKINLREAIEVDLSSVVSQFIKIYGFDPEPLERELALMPIKMGKAWHNELLHSAAITDGVVDHGSNYWGSLVPHCFH